MRPSSERRDHGPNNVSPESLLSPPSRIIEQPSSSSTCPLSVEENKEEHRDSITGRGSGRNLSPVVMPPSIAGFEYPVFILAAIAAGFFERLGDAGRDGSFVATVSSAVTMGVSGGLSYTAQAYQAQQQIRQSRLIHENETENTQVLHEDELEREAEQHAGDER